MRTSDHVLGRALRLFAEAAAIVFFVFMCLIGAAVARGEDMCFLYQTGTLTTTVRGDIGDVIWQDVAPIKLGKTWTGGGEGCEPDLCLPVTVLFETHEYWFLGISVWSWPEMVTDRERAAFGSITKDREDCVSYVPADTRPFFRNGFESGNLCAWDRQVGGVTRPGWNC